jgi:glycosyltransferase involved in cell wall biosynthesis
MKILHITPHLGGGIGTAFTGITKQDAQFHIEHEFVLLEKPEKTGFVERIRANGAAVFIKPDTEYIVKEIEKTDIVQINWWHHPLTAKFLYDFPDIPVRLVCWVHVSGCTYPYLRRDFFNKFDKIFFTTPYSYENPEIAQWIREDGNDKTSVIYGMGDVSRFFDVKLEQHDDFRIGYLGTFDFNKLHPDFVQYCAAAAVVADDIKFVMIGDETNKNILLKQASEYGIAERFEFHGYCEEVGKKLSQLDCMGYLLNPYHFGATENAILETMATGLPVIAINQNTEKYIIENNKNGFLINNPDEYGNVVKLLYHDSKERNRIAKNARERMEKNYSTKENTRRLFSCYENVMQQTKRNVNFHDIFGEHPSDWFLHFVENERAMFTENQFDNIPEIFKGESKSSIKHFAKYFPDDKRLINWQSKIMSDNKSFPK